MTTPIVTPPSDLLSTLANGVNIKFNVTGELPGENLIISIMAYATEVRKTIDPTLMARIDAITVQQMEDVQKIWRGIWVALGLLK